MSDEAEVAGAIAKGIVQGASQGLNDLLISAFGPAATEFGLMLQDEVRTMRLKRGVKLFAVAKEKLDKIGAQVRRVPEKLMLTILSEATLEDDEGLRQIWANLLASAANSAEESEVYPSFPTILRELTPRDVKFLDALFTDALESRRREQDRKVEEVMLHPKRVNDIYAQVCLGVRLADVHGIKALEVLEATGRGRRLSMDTFERNNIVMKILKVIRPELDNDPELGMTYSFTGLGACFVSACRGPTCRSLTPSIDCGPARAPSSCCFSLVLPRYWADGLGLKGRTGKIVNSHRREVTWPSRPNKSRLPRRCSGRRPTTALPKLDL